jgi:hypothetical protein
MTDDQFKNLCNVYGFAPSRSLRELLDSATAQAVISEREACAQSCEARYMGDNNREDMEARRCADAIRARGQA